MGKKNLLKMNDKQTLQFIGLCQSEEVLWNPLLDGYRNQESRTVAAKRIAKAMAITGFCADHVIAKFKNLRSSYYQELKKISACEKSKTYSDERYTPIVIWFNTMDSFLRPYVNFRDIQRDNLYPSKTRKPESYANKEDCESLLESNRLLENQNDDSNDSTATEPYSIPSFLYKNEINSPTKKRYTSQKRKIESPSSKLSSDNDAVLLSVKKLENISDRLLTKPKQDTFDHFGIYIASVLRDLPTQKACQLVQKITNIAMESIMDLSNSD